MSVKNSRPIYLKSLEMEGFQCFTKPVRLDFAAITLLYGPNSAGKSAVFDALDLAKEFWSSIYKLDINNWKKSSVYCMSQKWRHISDNENRVEQPLRIAVELECPRESEGSQYSKFVNDEFMYKFIYSDEMFIRSLGGKLIRLEFSIEKIVTQISIFADEKPILEISGYQVKHNTGPVHWRFDSKIYSEDSIEDNIIAELLGDKGFSTMTEHIPMGEIRSRDDDIRYKKEASEYLKKNQTLDGFEFKVTPGYFHNMPYAGSIEKVSDYSGKYWQDSYHDAFHLYGTFSDGNHIERASFDSTKIELLHCFGRLLVNIFDEAVPLVKASRNIPTPEDTFAYVKGVDLGCDKDYLDALQFSEDAISSFLFQTIGQKDEHLRILANLAKAKAISNRILNGEYWDVRELGYVAELDAMQFATINKYLSDHFFAEKGYRVDAEIKFLYDLNNSDNIDQIENILRSPMMVKLNLFDSDNRKLEFEDVGSGLSFVLPVLVSISGFEISQIQQPELHLHPALQSSLADAIIDRHNDHETDYGRWQTIIETHSEHLLLRLLRRIRETELNRDLEDKSDDFEWFQLNITARKSTDIFPDDVAIFYFNPLVEGGVEIRKMLVTPLGDFYNTWPRGFFDERYKDIFDE